MFLLVHKVVGTPKREGSQVIVILTLGFQVQEILLVILVEGDHEDDLENKPCLKYQYFAVHELNHMISF